MEKMVYGILTLNFIIIFMLTIGIFYPFVGIVFTMMSILATLLLYNNTLGFWLIELLIKNKGMANHLEANGRKILLSAGFIGLALKLGTLYGCFLFGGTVIVLFIVIVLAFGLLFEGRVEDFVGAYYLAKIIARVAIFISSWMDPIINFVIKIEFKRLGIETI